MFEAFTGEARDAAGVSSKTVFRLDMGGELRNGAGDGGPFLSTDEEGVRGEGMRMVSDVPSGRYLDASANKARGPDGDEESHVDARPASRGAGAWEFVSVGRSETVWGLMGDIGDRDGMGGREWS